MKHRCYVNLIQGNRKILELEIMINHPFKTKHIQRENAYAGTFFRVSLADQYISVVLVCIRELYLILAFCAAGAHFRTKTVVMSAAFLHPLHFFRALYFRGLDNKLYIRVNWTLITFFFWNKNYPFLLYMHFLHTQLFIRESSTKIKESL